jgi:hypothetical protein
MSENLMLFIDSCSYSGFNLQLCESQNDGRTRFRGKFQEAEAINKNKRMYPYAVLDENVKRLQEALDNRRLLGELDHPTDSIIHFANASHVVTRLWWEGNCLMGEGEILNTPSGKILKALINDGVGVGISSRGVGNGSTNEDGVLVIGESYKLITFDAVADPSTFSAFQKRIVGNDFTKSESINISRGNNNTIKTSSNSQFSSVKNENTSIDKITKEALIACLGGIIKSKCK